MYGGPNAVRNDSTHEFLFKAVQDLKKAMEEP
jgi:hypothetical protein